MFNLDPDPNRITRSDLIEETPKEKRQRLMAKNWGLCIYCDEPGTTLDHIVPKKSGLSFVNKEWNLYPCCKRCNSSKAD